jgi:hypothetical protein
MCSGPTSQTAFYAKNLSADARAVDDPRAAGAASGISVREAAARYEAARRSCCMCPAASPARAASDPARDTPDSNTAPSNREDIASSRLAKCLRRNATVKLAGLCAVASSVSREIYTISRGTLSESKKRCGGLLRIASAVAARGRKLRLQIIDLLLRLVDFLLLGVDLALLVLQRGRARLV